MEEEHWTEKIFKTVELQSMDFTLCVLVICLDSDRKLWVMLKNSEESMAFEVVLLNKAFSRCFGLHFYIYTAVFSFNSRLCI